ncbi:acyltransferase family protein [Sphingomonas sp. 22L2VL55-3]
MLRGFAALLVLFQHLAETIIATHALPLPIEQAGVLLFDGIFHFGRFGVALFFLISGFVIPFSFRTDRPVRGFAISRAFRLYPAYWLSLGVALLVLHMTGARAPAAVTIVANVAMIQHYVGQPDIVVAYWTLATELAFYVLAACLVAWGCCVRRSSWPEESLRCSVQRCCSHWRLIWSTSGCPPTCR